MCNRIPGLAIVIVSIVLSILTPSFAADRAERGAISLRDLYFLDSKVRKTKALVCYIANGKSVLGTFNRGTNSFKRFKPSASERTAFLKAERECVKKSRRPVCNDSRDNDGDGTRDFGSDPGCESATDTDESDPAAPTVTPTFTNSPTPTITSTPTPTRTPGPESVFRKPFADEYPLVSVFDHQFPQQFVHTDGVIITGFDDTTTIGVDGHQGYDFVMAEGTPLLAAYDGEITFAGMESPFFCPLLNTTTAGLSVRIRHTVAGKIYESVYAHFSRIDVTAGQSVVAGQQLGLSGNTGCSTGPHLHFDIQQVLDVQQGTRASVNPYGWQSEANDPWEAHPSGAASPVLWQSEFEPLFFREAAFPPNPGVGNSAPVAITTVRWAGPLDSANPNNEYVELTLDPRFTTSPLNLSGFYLRNKSSERYTFPAGTFIHEGTPIRVYSGSGTNTATVFYWGRTDAGWSNDGDCAQLIRPSGFRIYFLFYGEYTCPQSSTAEVTSGGGVTTILEQHAR